MIGRPSALVAVMLLLGGVCATREAARADGGLIVPKDWLRDFAEQKQLAVVEVRPEATASVDLYVSLSDQSGEPRQLHFVLPLQTVPRQFFAQEMPLSQFRKSKLDPLDNLRNWWHADARAHRNAVHTAFRMASIAAGPCASGWLLPRPRQRAEPVGAAEPSTAGAAQPVLTVETEHSRAQVYGALRLNELAGLAGLAELPPAVAGTLADYAGQPFALVRLHTIPHGQDTSGPAPATTAEEEGIVFSFAQEMLDCEEGRCYDYPLGTGGAWEHPIPLTRIYVSASNDLPLSVDFPGRREQAASVTDGAKRRVIWPQSAGIHVGSTALYWGAKDVQVYAAEYLRSNPTEDIRICLLQEGESAVGAVRRARSRALFAAYVGCPLLAALAWLLPFGLIVWPDPRARKFGLLGALGRGWATAYVVLLVPILVLRFLTPVTGPPKISIAKGYTAELLTAGTTEPLGLTGLVVLCLIMLGVLLPHLLPERGRFIARVLLASLAAGLIYGAVGKVLLMSLAG